MATAAWQWPLDHGHTIMAMNLREDPEAQSANLASRPDRQNRGRASDGKDPARANWERYEYCKQRGHVVYCEQAKRNEEYYLGAGLQWPEDAREHMETVQKALCIELNEIFDAVNNITGYQINNRADISYKPRGQGATEHIAKTLSQVAMQIADNNQLPYHETQVFMDGMIQQRGYFEVGINFDDTLRGEVFVDTLDPLDVIPDPDAKSYDPDHWADVLITRWLTLEEIELRYGAKARRLIELRQPTVNERDFGFGLNEVDRNKFGENDWGYSPTYDAYYREGGIWRARVIDRQHWEMELTQVVVYPTGDIRIAENATPEQLASFRRQGCTVMRRMTKRVRWTVSTSDVTLFDQWSPHNHFTVVPYFPYFRRGKTRGLVDNAIGPQDMLNKAITKFVQAMSTMANSGWEVEQNSLTNMDTEDLEERGAENGLVLEYLKGTTPPKKIEPNQVPNGIEHLVQLGSQKIKAITGNTDAARGQGGKQQSGLSVQSQQYGAQLSTALPLDNLGRTRKMMAGRFIDMIQKFYTEDRILHITHTDPTTGQKSTQPLRINYVDDDAASDEVLNNLTIGEYDAVITEQPAQITFENSQYNQAIEMKEKGIAIPDDVPIRYSALADKTEIIERMNAQPKGNPVDEAKAILLKAQAMVAEATAVAKNIEALFSGVRTAQLLAGMPQLAGMGDAIAHSAGFVDKDAAPILPTGDAAASATAPPPPVSTNPATPDHPDVGANAGIEAGPTATGA